MSRIFDLDLRHVIVQAGDFRCDIDTIHFKSGVKCAIVGANGAGKSMLLGAIAGSVGAKKRDILICGEPIERWRESRENSRQFATVGHTAIWPDFMKVKDVVELISALYSVDPSHANQTEEALEIRQLRTLFTSDLSAGQSQRLRLFEIFASRAQIVLLDEPLTALDAIRARSVADQLKKITFGVLLMGCHHPLEISACNSLLWLRNGRLQYFGSIVEFMNAYIGDVEVTVSGETGSLDALGDKFSGDSKLRAWYFINSTTLCFTGDLDLGKRIVSEALSSDRFEVVSRRSDESTLLKFCASGEVNGDVLNAIQASSVAQALKPKEYF
jgi:ABC-type multidrug transport system ATPase subunit